MKILQTKFVLNKTTGKRILNLLKFFAEEWLFYSVMITFILGIIGAGILNFASQFLLPILVGAVVLFMITLICKAYKLLLVVGFLLGLFWCSVDLANLANFQVPVGRTVVVQGQVTEILATKDNYISNITEQITQEENLQQSFVLQVDEKGKWQGKLLIYTDTEQVKVGDRLEVKALVTPVKENANFRVSPNKYLRNNSIAAGLRVVPNGIRILELEQGNLFTNFAKNTKAKIYEALEVLPTNQQAYIKGIAFGDKTMLSGGQQQVLSQTGIIHIFAVSGLHIGFVVMFAMGFVNLLSKIIRLRPVYKLLMIAAVTLFYSTIVGFSPSVTRAAIMSLVTAFILLYGENGNKGIIILAACFCLLWEPLWIFDLGFQLSFLATAGIVFTKDIWAVITKFGFLQTTLGAQFMVMPIVAYRFNIITTIGLLLSPLAAAGSGVVVILVLFSMLLVWVGLGDIPLYGAGLLADWMFRGAEFFAELPVSWVAVLKPTLGAIALYYLCLALAYYFLYQVKKIEPLQPEEQYSQAAEVEN